MTEKLLVPDIGDFENVEVIELLVKEGQEINKNDPVVTIESDKSSVEIPSTISGKIELINVKLGDKVSKGDLLLTIESSKKTTTEKEIPKDTDNIIKQAEAVLKVEEKKKILHKEKLPKKETSKIQLINWEYEGARIAVAFHQGSLDITTPEDRLLEVTRSAMQDGDWGVGCKTTSGRV